MNDLLFLVIVVSVLAALFGIPVTIICVRGWFTDAGKAARDLRLAKLFTQEQTRKDYIKQALERLDGVPEFCRQWLLERAMAKREAEDAREERRKHLADEILRQMKEGDVK